MIRGDEQKITSDPLAHGLVYEARKPKTRGGTTPFLKLSAKMVDLSLQQNQDDSLLTDIPAHFPAKSECYPPEPKVQLTNASLATTTQEEAKKAARPHSGLVQASRELLRRSISWISDHRVRPRLASLDFEFGVRSACSGIVVLVLLAFSAVYGFRRYHQDSLKSHSQIPTAVQQRENAVAPATSIASKNTHTDAHTVAPSKSKSRRRQGDYIAKDTYAYYGKDGKPSHTQRK